MPIVVVFPVPLTPTTRTMVGPSAARAEHRRLAEERLDLFRERAAEIAQLAASLEAPDELGGRRDADIRADEGDLEPFPGVLLRGVERRSELCDERAAALPERVTQPREEPDALLGLARPLLRVPEELRPRPRHRWEPTRAARRTGARFACNRLLQAPVAPAPRT